MIADPSPWLAVFGRAHPVLLHAPLGLLPALFVFEFGPVLLRREVARGSVLTLSVLTALTGAAAAASGFVLGGEQDGSELLTQHKTTGLVLGGLCLLLPLLALRHGRGPFRVLLLLALGVMVPAGHLGGSITHGRDFLFEPLHTKSTTAAAAAPAQPNALPPAAVGTAAPTFVTDVLPILERVCTSCHNPDKVKGELLLTTREGLDRGGENGAVVVPGKPDDSPLLTRCLLPADHDDHMPPDGKKQPTAEELQTLRQWIAAGAR
ncbi:MAG: hypothetical protein MUC36_22075 [Planctomycetes bacterium]|jgi:uncharacterized membrane protein|nr:hypothetical protein [Planctomycetota bacterium]